MKISIEVFNILLLLLPGLISSQIFYSIMSQKKEISASKRIYDSIIFSFLSYLLVAMVMPWSPILQVTGSKESLSYAFSDNKLLVLLNLVTMVVIPIVLAAILQNDFFHGCLRRMKVTTKSSRESTWNDVLLSEDRHIVIHLRDERRIRGYPIRFSSDADEGYIYFFNPAWVNDDKQNDEDSAYIETGAHGFLVNRSDIDLIEFSLKPGEELDSIK